MKYKKYILLLIVGLALFGIFHYFTKPEWTNSASIDTILGVLIDFFIIQILIMWYEDKQEQKFIKHLENHLRHIEKLIIENKPKK